jgi:hypothetical protein
MTQPRLKFGDRVRLKFDIVDHPIECLEQTILDGTQGSIGIIVSADEYRAFREEKARRQYPESWQTFIKKREDLFQGIDATAKRGILLLVRFETVLPPSRHLEEGDFVNCHVGDVKQVHVDCLEKIESV